MKRCFVALICMFFISCSAVFDGGISGYIYESDGKTGFGGVHVYLYSSEDDRKSDYDNFVSGNGNIDLNGNFIPNENLYIPRAVTNSDGYFEISKVVWGTNQPMFGKTDDVHTVYILLYKDSAAIDASGVNTEDSHDGLIYWPMSYKMVSSSKNPSLVSINLCRVFKTFLGVSGYIRSADGANSFGTSEDDSNTVNLYYCDSKSKNESGGYIWSSAKNGGKKNASVKTVSASLADDSYIATHGNFDRLGLDSDFYLIYDSSTPSQKDDGYMYYYIEYDNGVSVKYSDAIKVYSSNFADVYKTNLDKMNSTAPDLPEELVPAP